MSNVVAPAQYQRGNSTLTTAVKFNNLRLPYDDAFAEFGVDNIRWKVLIDSIYPAAKTVDSIAMVLSYCRSRNLDPFKRPVHIVPVYSKAARGYIETVWPGIAELRTTASRTGQYAGCDAAEFGPTLTKTFTGEINDHDGGQNAKKSISVTIEFPEWARLTIRRIAGGHVASFVGPKVYWIESYARQGKSDVPNEMWTKRRIGQIEKCAEAAALRRAFPEELGNEYAAEEMEGQSWEAIGEVAAPEPKPARLPPNPNTRAAEAFIAPSATVKAAASPNPDRAAGAPPAPAKPSSKPQPFDFHAYRAALQSAETSEEIDAIWLREVESRDPQLTEEDENEAQEILREVAAKFWADGSAA